MLEGETFETKWLKVTEILVGNKTSTFLVEAKAGAKLGYIKWFGRWHQYSFFPEPYTVFEKDCLKDLGDLLIMLMRRHQTIRRKREDRVQEG